MKPFRIFNIYFNPNKTGLFEGSFSGMVNLTPSSYFKKTNVISIQLYIIVKQPV